ncbi:CAP domain-containing protein [Streptomyces sp. RKAG337]|uniref:CAP domain-containing protein n=1 Tax=Streptomyces sp. RKAG337 TaxID=2893404 RepID=UPI0020335A7A|nr:CAP domain-containing protein [Streptomyces sp. RKAG337]MCM2425899.1 CAP domain-containing protein [Streptomyces sp. RKAG337]
MGRHSRNATEAVAPTRSRRGHRGPRRRHSAVRTGLLASSAALAVGAVAMSSGLLSSLNGGPGGITAQGSPGGTRTQPDGSSGPSLPETGYPSPSTTGRTSVPSSPSTTRGGTPSTTPTTPPTSAAAPSTTPAPKVTPTRTPVTPRPTTPSATPSPTATPTPKPTPTQDGTAVTAQAAVLKLVNAERAKVGCSPVTADPSLAKLAQAFSEDMAIRDFFDHTDPDGDTPWDRAKSAGVTNLGGENIARGQADADAVMTAWMNSAGHRANILNCDYKTLGIGVHYAPGGPWWTQDFGF